MTAREEQFQALHDAIRLRDDYRSLASMPAWVDLMQTLEKVRTGLLLGNPKDDQGAMYAMGRLKSIHEILTRVEWAEIRAAKAITELEKMGA